MRRRDFIAGLGSAAACPVVGRAQQTATPVVGFLGAPAAAPYARFAAAIRGGLRDSGFIEGQNLQIYDRWADGHYDRLPELAADLVARRVAAIIPIGGAPATVAAKAATPTIPIVFNMTADPVALGLVASLNRPGGNVTGVAMLGVALEAKRLELLHEIVPAATSIAVLVNPTNAQTDYQLRDLQEAAARGIGHSLLVLNASSEREIETAFGVLVRERARALLVGQDSFFTSVPNLFAELTARNGIPAISPWRVHVEAGCLMSYGASLLDSYRQTGVYAGRVLKGEKPADLPIMQAVRFEFVINLKTAKTLGLTVPNTLLVSADEVIE
jgi:putative tryptophan/tyrosine transport system substrate-binding protein